MAIVHPTPPPQPAPPEYPARQYPTVDYPPQASGPFPQRGRGSRAAERTEPSAAVRVAHGFLRLAFVVLPIVAGADKFFHFLVNWDQYLSPTYAAIVGTDTQTLMYAVGIVEIAAGLLVAIALMVGGFVVMFWLWAIIANLCLVPGYLDIALRDFGLSMGALAMALLTPATKVRVYHDGRT